GRTCVHDPPPRGVQGSAPMAPPVRSHCSAAVAMAIADCLSAHAAQHAAIDSEVGFSCCRTYKRTDESGTTTAELRRLLAELRVAVDDPAMLLAGPRIVQTWARKPQ